VKAQTAFTSHDHARISDPKRNTKRLRFNLGGAISRHDIDVVMDHEGAECAVDGLYMVEGSQHTDTHSLIDHRQPHCTSRQLYKEFSTATRARSSTARCSCGMARNKLTRSKRTRTCCSRRTRRFDTKPQLEIYAD
jgi:Fe-S cluster assembly protein SufD